MKLDAPPTGQPASSLGGLPTTSTTPVGSILSGTLLIVGVACGASLVLINILIIGCCLRKRTTKQIKRGKSKQFCRFHLSNVCWTYEYVLVNPAGCACQIMAYMNRRNVKKRIGIYCVLSYCLCLDATVAHLFQFYVVRFWLLSWIIHCSRLHIGPKYDKVELENLF